MPIYKKDYMPATRKNALLGLNWYTQNSNTFRKSGKTTTGVAMMKAIIHSVIKDNAEAILKEDENWDTRHCRDGEAYGFKVKYTVFLKRLGSDGTNVRSAMEKMVLDGIQEAGIIDNDKFVYKTSSEFYLQRSNPRIEIEISHIEEPYQFIID